MMDEEARQIRKELLEAQRANIIMRRAQRQAQLQEKQQQWLEEQQIEQQRRAQRQAERQKAIADEQLQQTVLRKEEQVRRQLARQAAREARKEKLLVIFRQDRNNVLVKQICNTCDRKNIRLLSGKLSEISVFVKGALHRQSGFTLDETANL